MRKKRNIYRSFDSDNVSFGLCLCDVLHCVFDVTTLLLLGCNCYFGYIYLHTHNQSLKINRNQQFVCFFSLPQTSRKDLPGTPVLENRCDFQWNWPHLFLKMDFQHRAGGKTGSGGVASASESNRDRRERLRQLALETIDINKDPYFMKNHLGSYECKLCLTLHNNEVRKSVYVIKWSDLNLTILCIWTCSTELLPSVFTGQLFGSHTRKETSDQFVSQMQTQLFGCHYFLIMFQPRSWCFFFLFIMCTKMIYTVSCNCAGRLLHDCFFVIFILPNM